MSTKQQVPTASRAQQRLGTDSKPDYQAQQDQQVEHIDIVRKAGIARQLLSAQDMGMLQDTIGNRAVQRMLHVGSGGTDASTGRATSLTNVGAGHPLGMQAIAMSVSPAPMNIQRQCPACEDDTLDRKPSDSRAQDNSTRSSKTSTGPEIESAIAHSRGSGQPLERDTRLQMESAFGTDFGGVQVHTDSEAHSLNEAIQARAFTTGHDIFFRQGEYNPASTAGQELLAHELTHVVQQSGSTIQGKLLIGDADDHYEREADHVARQVVNTLNGAAALQHHSSTSIGGAPVQRQCACGGHTTSGGECEECRRKREANTHFNLMGDDSAIEQLQRSVSPVSWLQRRVVCPPGVSEEEGTGCYEVADEPSAEQNYTPAASSEQSFTPAPSQQNYTPAAPPEQNFTPASSLPENDSSATPVSQDGASSAASLDYGSPVAAAGMLAPVPIVPTAPPPIPYAIPGGAAAAELGAAGAAGAEAAAVGVAGAEAAAVGVAGAEAAGAAGVGAVMAGEASIPVVGWIALGLTVLAVGGYLGYRYLMSEDGSTPVRPLTPEENGRVTTTPPNAQQVGQTAAPPQTQPAMPTNLTPAEQELWRRCNELHDTYKATQDEAAALAARMDVLRNRLMQNQATPQERLDFCLLLDERIRIVQRLHQERSRYMNLDCDQFDWFNTGSTAAQRRAAHQAELDNVSRQLDNFFELRNRFYL